MEFIKLYFNSRESAILFFKTYAVCDNLWLPYLK